MPGRLNRAKKPKVVVEEAQESDHSDETDENDEEPGDDMDEIKEDDEDEYDFLSDAQDVMNSSVEVKSDEDVEIKSEDDDDLEIKSEEDDEDDENGGVHSDEEGTTSGDISDDSDVPFDSEDGSPKSKEKVKQKEKKHVRIDKESSEESDTSDSEEEDEEDKPKINDEHDAENARSGLADVMAQILATTGGNNTMLSKAKKDNMTVKKEDIGEFEFVDAEGNVKKEVKIEVKDEEDEDEKARRKLREKEEIIKTFKRKPNFEADRVKERNLRIVATQGVVQLFTAIEKHKTVVRKKRLRAGSLVAQEELSMRDLKESFLDILDKEGDRAKQLYPKKRVKKEVKDEPINLPSAEKMKPKWSVFSENFYKEPTLQGWDLKSDEED